MDTFAYTVNCSILLTDLPLLQRPQAARDAGFDAVEFWWPFDAPVPLIARSTSSSVPSKTPACN